MNTVLLVLGLLVLLGLISLLWMTPERYHGFWGLGLVLLGGPVLLWMLYASQATPREAAVLAVESGVAHEVALAHQHAVHQSTHFDSYDQPAWTRGPRGDELVAIFSTIFGLFGVLWLISRLFDRAAKIGRVA